MTKLTVLVTLAVLAPYTVLADETPGSHFIENWDLDGNRSVSLEEITERRGMVFTMFDQNEDGSLDADEYVLFDETRAADMEMNAGGQGKGGDRMQEGLTLGFNDTNEDGAVSMDEFVSNSAAWVAQVDRDGDSMITAADFGPRGN
ncbi:EF-hand domain-containing protein [Octadecabacter sp.]|nr:EF-hand domain-containing protein [Octadecabacter sp.]